MKRFVVCSLFLFFAACVDKDGIVLSPIQDFFSARLLRSASSTCLADNVSLNSLTAPCGAIPANLPELTLGANYVAASDLARGVYQGFLYPGQNALPTVHQKRADSVALLIIPINGKIKVVAEGMSNSGMIFDGLINVMNASSFDNSAVQITNFSKGGCDLPCWISNGVGTVDSSVQVVLAYHSNNRPQSTSCVSAKRFPTHALNTKTQLESRFQQLRQKYPKARQFYFFSREFGGWSNPPSGSRNSEPVAYEEGYSVKWFIESHLNEVPVVLWGAYTWDRMTPRSYFTTDGTHPCIVGQNAFGQKLFDYFLNNSSSRPWFAANP